MTHIETWAKGVLGRHSAIALLLLLCILCIPARVEAQLPPVFAGIEGPVRDEFDQILEGTEPSSSVFGIPYVEGDLVQIVSVDSGVLPPDTDGNPQGDNTVLYTARIGEGVSPNLERPGMFGKALVPRPNGQILVRVFNAPTQEDASFYGDSQVFSVNGGEVFIAQISKTDTPLDPNDDDGDGLNNSWEKSHGSDRNNPDSDGDGSDDHTEHLAGTDLTDAESAFVVARLSWDTDHLVVEWDAIPGKTYRVEYTDGDPDGSSGYVVASEQFTATDYTIQAPIAQGFENDRGAFLVRLIYD